MAIQNLQEGLKKQMKNGKHFSRLSNLELLEEKEQKELIALKCANYLSLVNTLVFVVKHYFSIPLPNLKVAQDGPLLINR